MVKRLTTPRLFNTAHLQESKERQPVMHIQAGRMAWWTCRQMI